MLQNYGQHQEVITWSTTNGLLRIFKSFVRPIMDYGDKLKTNLIMNQIKLNVFDIKHV